MTVFIFTHFYLRSDRADILKVLFVVSNDPNVVDLNVDIDAMLLSNDGVKFVSILAFSVEAETVAVTALALAAVVFSSADVVVSLAIDDGSIVVASVLLVLAYDRVDCNTYVELVSVWLDTVLELAVDGVKFVDLVSTLVEDKDSELLCEPTVTVVDSVACAILLVLTSGVVDPVLTASLV